MVENSLRIKRIDQVLPTRMVTAQSLANHGRYDEALAEVHAARCDNPELAAAHLLEGLIRWRRQDLSRARSCLAWATRLDKESVESWQALAAVCREMRDFRAALRAIDQVLCRAWDDPDAHLLRGAILRELGRRRSAGAALRRALKLNPTLTSAHLLLAQLALDQQRPDAAYRHVKVALQLGTLHYDTALEMGLVLRQSGHRAEAIVHYRKLIREYPTRAMAYIKLAEFLLEQPDDAAALPLLSLAIHLEPANTAALVHLANLYRRQGRHETADEIGYTARRLDPSLTYPVPLPEKIHGHASS